MKNISKKAFREKQERIAQELGLIDKPIAMSITRPLPPGYEKKVEEPIQEFVIELCGEDCPGGTHKMDDGRWCINNRIWSHGECSRMKQLKVIYSDELVESIVNNKALMILDKELQLDLSTLTVL